MNNRIARAFGVLALALTLSFAAPPQAQAFDFFCSVMHIGCPPPAAPLVPAGVMQPTALNARELATYAQAHALASYLNTVLVGARILPGDDSFDISHSALPVGIYVPAFYGTSAPAGEDAMHQPYYFLHFLLSNGASFNVGLAMDKFARYPLNPDYVVGQLALEMGVTVLPR